jgi:hypothetical protein
VDAKAEAGLLCGVWEGDSFYSSGGGSTTRWDGVLLYFNLQTATTGKIKGRGVRNITEIPL